ncbi:MAG: DUF1330 domain-containing protein, partial [Proteobacteria bacterium]|nr:DUF1330 domain-containing protein [Pseudomonadota bacterium]
VVDSADLPLNVSREMIQTSPVFTAIRKGVTNRILQELTKTAENDAEAYAEYSRQVPATIEQYGGRFLVRGGHTTQVEGDAHGNRRVVIEFPDRDTLVSWYHGPEYQAILPIRHANSVGTIAFVDGVET